MSTSDPKNDSTGYLYMALGFVGLGLIGVLGMVTARLGPAAIPIWGMAMGGIWVISRSPIGHAIAERITGRPANEVGTLDVPPELYAELDELRARLSELEERTDFAERLLASRTDLPGTP